jgi:hypothetical protein
MVLSRVVHTLRHLAELYFMFTVVPNGVVLCDTNRVVLYDLQGPNLVVPMIPSRAVCNLCVPIMVVFYVYLEELYAICVFLKGCPLLYDTRHGFTLYTVVQYMYLAGFTRSYSARLYVVYVYMYIARLYVLHDTWQGCVL